MSCKSGHISIGEHGGSDSKLGPATGLGERWYDHPVYGAAALKDALVVARFHESRAEYGAEGYAKGTFGGLIDTLENALAALASREAGR